MEKAADPANKLAYRNTMVTIGGSGFDWHDVESYFRPNAIGSYSFDENNNVVFNKLDKLFDVAVMMDCSQCPIHPKLKSVFTDYAKKNSDIVRAKGARPVFFMSWAYADKPEMTAQLAEAYTVAGNANNALVIPAGLAFAKAVGKQPELNLYAPDKRHPVACRNLSGDLRGVCGADRALAGRQQLSRGDRCADRDVPAERRVGDRAGILREVDSRLVSAVRHCEERSDEAIHASACGAMDCFASLAMTLIEFVAPTQRPITPCAWPLPSAGPAR